MTELITIILTVIGVGLSLAAINITTFFYLLGRLTKVEKRLATVEERLVILEKGLATVEGRLVILEKGLATVEGRLTTVEKEVAFIHGLLVGRPDDAVLEQ